MVVNFLKHHHCSVKVRVKSWLCPTDQERKGYCDWYRHSSQLYYAQLRSELSRLAGFRESVPVRALYHTPVTWSAALLLCWSCLSGECRDTYVFSEVGTTKFFVSPLSISLLMPRSAKCQSTNLPDVPVHWKLINKNFLPMWILAHQWPPPPITAARSRQYSWASSAKKIRPLEKKLGRKPATPQITGKSAVQNFCSKFLGQFLPSIVKIGRKLGNLELGRFLGRWLPRQQEILLGHFWVQRPWIRPSGTSAANRQCWPSTVRQ